MALPPTIYRASIQLSDLDRNCYEHLQVTVAQHPSEKPERLVARLLAYALCYQEGLVFTKGICAGDEPDLWLKGPDGRVLLWLEVGLPEAERLVKAARHAEQVVLFACGSGRWRWEAAQLERLARVKNLSVFGLEQEFLEQLVTRLKRGIDWTLTRTEGTLYLTLADEGLEGPLDLLLGENPSPLRG